MKVSIIAVAFLKIYLFCLMFVSVLPACMDAHHVHAWWPRRSEQGIEFPGSRVIDGCMPLSQCLELNIDPL